MLHLSANDRRVDQQVTVSCYLEMGNFPMHRQFGYQEIANEIPKTKMSKN